MHMALPPWTWDGTETGGNMPNIGDPFLSKGIFLWQVPDILQGDPARIAQALCDAGFESVYIKAADANHLFPSDGHPQLSLALVQALHGVGIAAVGWGFCYGIDAMGEADAAIAACNRFGLDGYIWDVESSFDGQPSAIAKAGNMVKRFKAGVGQPTPTAYCGWAHYWDPITGGEWHPATVARAFMEECDFAMPMMYWPGSGGAAAFLGTSVGEWKQITTKPIVAVGRAYDGDGGKAVPAQMAAFDAAARAAGCGGTSWWYLENAYNKPALWAALKAMNPFGPSKSVTVALPAHDQVTIVSADGKVCTGRAGEEICSPLIRDALVGAEPPAVGAGIHVHVPPDNHFSLVLPDGRIYVGTRTETISWILQWIAGTLPLPTPSTITAALQRLKPTANPLVMEGEVELDHVGHDLVKFHVLTFDPAQYEFVVDNALWVTFPHVWMKNVSCEYATNGGAGWHTSTPPPNPPTTSIYGLSAFRGKKFGKLDPNWQQMYVDVNGCFSLSNAGALYTTFPFTNLLVKDGVAQQINKAPDYRARTAVGQRADNKTIIVTTDGGDYNKTHGMTFQEVAELMAGLGCTLAVMVDGGGSTCMAHRDAADVISIIGVPSGEEHVVVNGLEYDIRPTAGHMGIRHR